MTRGGIYGRSREYPYTAGRIKRIFRTAIRVDYDNERRYRRNSVNANALNKHHLHVMFAYEFRPGSWRNIPGGGGEYRETPMPHLTSVDSQTSMMDLRITITLPKAA